MIHNIGPINACNTFEIDEFRKHAKIVCFIWRHVTQTRYVVRLGAAILLIGISIRNIVKPTSDFHVFWRPWSLSYVLFFVTRTGHDVLEFPSSTNGWYATRARAHTRTHAHTHSRTNSLTHSLTHTHTHAHTHTHTHIPKVKSSLANPFGAGLIIKSSIAKVA